MSTNVNPKLLNLANSLMELLIETEVARKDCVLVKITHEDLIDSGEREPTVRVHVKVHGSQLVTVTVGWLFDEVTPNYFVNWSGGSRDFVCFEGTPHVARAMFNMGQVFESVERFVSRVNLPQSEPALAEAP